MKRRNLYRCRKLVIVLTVQEVVASFLSHTPSKSRYFGSTNIHIGYQGSIVRQYILQ